MRTAAICPTCATYFNAVCILYDGPGLANIPAAPLDNLDTILVALNGTIGTINTNINNRVPYTGATGNVNLGSNNITANAFIKAGGLSTQFLKADGSIDSNTYLTSSSALTTYVPYTGATSNVNLGTNSLTTNNLTITGAFSSAGSPGVLGQVLVSQGVGVSPQWQTPIIPTIDQVLASGNTATDKDLIINTTGVGSITLDGTGLPRLRVAGTVGLFTYQGEVNAAGTSFKDVSANRTGDYNVYGSEYVDIGSGNSLTISANPANFNSNTLTYPSGNGTFAISVNGTAADSTGNVTLTPPYKVYTAVISQAGTNPPTVNYILENTLGFVPTWGYNNVGRYEIIAPAFNWVASKVVVFINPGYPAFGVITGWERNSDTIMTIHTQNPSPVNPFDPWQNDLLFTATIEVRIYP